jgi:Leu/Phe-tRNA-protein transferase
MVRAPFKNTHINIALDNNERAVIEQAAMREGYRPSTWARKQLLDAAKAVKAKEGKL